MVEHRADNAVAGSSILPLGTNLNGSVAQSGEQRTHIPRVGGSIPSTATITFYAIVAQLVEHRTENPGVTGSTPVFGTTYNVPLVLTAA